MSMIDRRHRETLVDFYNMSLSIDWAISDDNLEVALELFEQSTDELAGGATELVRLRQALRSNGHLAGIDSTQELLTQYRDALEKLENLSGRIVALRRRLSKKEATGPALVLDADDRNKVTHITIMDGTNKPVTVTMIDTAINTAAQLKEVMGEPNSMTGSELVELLLGHDSVLRPSQSPPAGLQARLVVDMQNWGIWRSKANTDDVERLR